MLDGVAGLLVGGLVTLAIPGVGTVVLAGTETAFLGLLAGGFYGSVSRALLGAAIGSSISDEQTKLYIDSLSQGHYLVMVEGKDEELAEAEPILKVQGIQDWGIYSTL